MSPEEVNKAAVPGAKELIVLLALLTSLIALCTDMMLPALPDIGRELKVADANDVQLVIAIVFVGLSAGMLIYGPLADSIGRRKTMFAGLALFIIGDLISITANDFTMFLFGRFLQGVGAAGPRVVSIALIRDLYVGQAMARVMSFIMTVFILVPVLAPGIGQLIIHISNWHMIFILYLCLALISLIWFYFRIPETLKPELRRPFTLAKIVSGTREVAGNPVVMGYTVVSGLAIGGMVGYLNMAQPILQVQYQLGAQFPVYFGVLAASIGVSTLVNTRLVGRFGMHKLSTASLLVGAILSLIYLPAVYVFDGHPPLWSLMLYLLLFFLALGLQFGNLNAMAMEPLGHLAGIGAGIISSFSFLIGAVTGIVIGQMYQQTIYPLVTGYLVMMGTGYLICLIINRYQQKSGT